jgi:hypothetical protein
VWSLTLTRKFFVGLRIAAIPILLGLIALLEIRRPVRFHQLLAFVFLFFVLADITTLLRGKLHNIVLMLTSLAFGLCLVEATANVLMPKPLLVYTPGESSPQPIIGWGPAHSGRFYEKKIDPRTGATIYDVEYTIDSHLLRQTLSCESGPAIVFFGDSFTFGYGVNDDQTFPQYFADLFHRKLRVLDLAFTGYGPQQFLRELQTGRFDDVIGPRPRLFVFLTAPWQAERTACKSSWIAHAPRYALENGQLVFKGACYEGVGMVLHEWLENTALYPLLAKPNRRPNHDDVDLYIRILSAAIDLAKEKYGVPTVVPYLRDQDYLSGTGFTDDQIIKRLEDGGAFVTDMSLAKQSAAGIAIGIPGEAHPNAYANRLRAVLLKDYLEQNQSDAIATVGSCAK